MVGFFSRSVSADRIFAIRGALGIKTGEKIIVTASRLVKKNAVDICISSLRFLPNEFKLVILGNGRDEAELKRLTNELGLQKRVVFAGFISHKELPQYLKACDIFVRPSRSEGLGNSFLEAMAAGIPVIGTDVGGISDFLIDGQTGYVCKVDDPTGVANLALKIFDNEAQKKKIVVNAMTMVRSKYAWGNISREMERILLGKV